MSTLPRRPKEAVVLIQNISKNTIINNAENFSTSQKLLELYIAGKLKYASKDEIGVITMGSRQTRHILAGNDEDNDEPMQLQHIQEIRKIDTLQFSVLKELTSRTEESLQNVARGNLLDALHVAATMIERHTGKKQYSRRIFVVTDGSIEPFEEDDLKSLAKSLLKSKINVNFLGVNEFFRGDSKIETLLMQFAQDTEGVCIPAQEAVELLGDLRNRAISPTTTYRGCLEIGNQGVGVPMWIFKKTEKTTLPTAKKMSAVSDLNMADNTGAVVRDRIYHPLDNPDAILEAESLIKGYSYGKNIVPMSKIDEDQLKYDAEKGFKLLGFADERSIPRQHYMAEVYVCIPPYGDENASMGFSTLIRGMAELGSVAIVRFQSRDNAEPRLAFLYPYFKQNYDCLYLNVLPYYEDLRQFPFRSFRTIQHTEEQLDAMDQLIEDMNLAPTKEEEELNPAHTYDPCLHYFYQCLHARALHNVEKLPEIEQNILDQCLPEQSKSSLAHSIQERIKQKSEDMNKLYDLQKVEEKGNKKRKYWFALGEGSASLASLESHNTEAEAAIAATEGGQQVKRLKMSDDISDFPSLRDGQNPEEQAFDLAARTSLFSHLAENVGTTDPAKDFREMIMRTDQDLTNRAVSQMQDVIMKLLKASIGDQFFDKTLKSLHTLRQGCIKEQESAEFNKFLHELKAFLLENNTAFWNLLKDNNITLISSDEANDSNVSPDESKQFFTSTQAAPTTQSPSLTQDEEGLFDDLD